MSEAVAIDHSPKYDERPWGSFTVLDEGAGYKVKRIEVLPGKRLSYQKHAQRAEHWFVVQGVARVTPLLESTLLNDKLGGRLIVKAEVLQRIGAFKFRGAYTYVSRLSADERSRGLVAPSSGNHGQAVALAARLFGVKATIVMPTTTPRAKVAGAERLGARVLFAGTTTAERMAKAMEVVAAESATLVPPYDHPWIIAGQGTAGLEIAEDAAALGLDDFTLLVQVGGGGLSAGVATAVKAVAPAARAATLASRQSASP